MIEVNALLVKMSSQLKRLFFSSLKWKILLTKIITLTNRALILKFKLTFSANFLQIRPMSIACESHKGPKPLTVCLCKIFATYVKQKAHFFLSFFKNHPYMQLSNNQEL